MHFTLVNFISATVIGVLIGVMALVRDVRLKATIYILPIPITVALITTHQRIESSHIVGIILVCCFIWATKQFHERLHMHIILADLLAASLYVAIGYLLIHAIHIPFSISVIIYLIGWVVFILQFHTHPLDKSPDIPSTTVPPYVKSAVTTMISYVIFAIKDLLSGIVVTFPFSGVFAVIETRQQLTTFKRVVMRNSIAIIGLFVSMYALQSHVHFATNLAIGWVIYFIILILVRRISV